MDLLYLGLLIVLFFLGMFTMELVHISSERKRVKREQKWDLNMDGFIKIDTSDPINPVKMWESTTTFGNTIKYPGQKPEDVFTTAELEDWARRNGWKDPVRVERWKI